MVFGILVDLALNMAIYGTISVSYLVPHPIFHHTLKPGYHRMRFWPDYDEGMYVNSFGMRNKEISERKAKHCYRILVLGDSFCMGQGVSDNQVFSVLLEKKLNQWQQPRDNHESKYEVLNFAVDTYVPLLEYLQFKHFGVRFDPDLVIQFFDMSDLMQEDALRDFDRIVAVAEDNRHTIIAIPGKEETGDKGWQHAFIHQVDAVFRYRFFLIASFYRRLDHWLTGDTKSRVLEEYGRYLMAYTFEEDQTPFEKQWQQIFESLLRTRTLCQQTGAVYVLATYPWKHQMATGGKETNCCSPFDKLASFSEKEDIHFINLSHDFRSYEGEEALYFQNDVHFTEAGHRVMAEALFRNLKHLIMQTSP